MGKLLPQRAKTKPGSSLILKQPHKRKTKTAMGRVKKITSNTNKLVSILKLATLALYMTNFPTTSVMSLS